MKTITKLKTEKYKFLPIPGRVYTHWKGGLYEVISLGIMEATKEEMVIYKSFQFGTIYIRPLKEWFEIVDGTIFGLGNEISRFQLYNN